MKNLDFNRLGGGGTPSLTSAFTLAEVLITLGIIGVVAAMTMPSLIAKHQEKVIVTQLKKVYSILSQVVYELNYEYAGSWTELTTNQLGNDITSRIKTLKVCAETEGCFEQAPVTYLKSGTAGDWNNWNRYKFILPDGANIMLSVAEDSPYYHWEKVPSFIFVIDVNGLKNPNRIGRDIFMLAIRDGKLIPSGIDEKSESCAKEMYGYTCAWKVLIEEKLNY